MKILATVFSFLAFLFFFQIYPNYTNTNEQSRLLLTSAIVDDHTFCIDRAIERYGDTQDKTLSQSRFFAAKAIGYSLLAVPFYFAVTLSAEKLDSDILIYFLRIFLNIIPLLFFTVFFFRYLRDSVGVGESSFLFIAVFLFGTLVYPYAQLFMSHLLTGLCWFVAFYLITERHNRTAAFIVGALLGISFLLEFPSLVTIAVFAVYLLLFKRNLVVPFSVGVAVSSAPVFLYNLYYFGGLFEWPYKYSYSPDNLAGHSGGYVGMHLPSFRIFWELTLGSSRGFFFYMPHLVFGIVGLLSAKVKRKEALLAFAVVVANFLFYSGYYFWDGGQAFGPRFLVPLIPFLIYGSALGCLQLKTSNVSRTMLNVCTFIYLFSFAVSVFMMVIGTVTFPFSPRFLPNPVLWESLTLFWRGFFGLNVGEYFGLPQSGIQVIAIVLVIIPVIYLVAKSKISRPQLLTFSVILISLFPTSFWLQKTIIQPRADARHCLVIGRVGYIQANYLKGLEFLNYALAKTQNPALKKEAEEWIAVINSKLSK